MAHAQSNPDQEKMAAVMSVIHMLLLEEEGPKSTVLSLNALQPNQVSIGEESPLTATFAKQASSVDFCFVLTSQQAASFTLTINGVAQTGNNQAVIGENCYSIPVGQQLDENTIVFSTLGGRARIKLLGIERSSPSRLGLATLGRRNWGEREVRKVLKIFAFGGHARDSQIIEWSNMPSSVAIAQMLNFSEHNLKLSPLASGERYRESASQHGTLVAWQNFMSSTSSNLPIPTDRRDQYGLRGYNFDDAYNRMITVRGLNPFRQRIGFWETNYHLAVNLDASVSRHQMARYYDDIMQAHAARVPYHEVMGVAAKSAAAAMQYGHRRNQWVFDRDLNEFICECNDDLARELHQLYYGIFGVNDPNHEDGTIGETAKMLTDMRVPYINNFGFAIDVNFETDQHHTGDLTILGQTISGADASAKIDNLMPKSILHPESLENLPVMIISVLADDNLNEARKDQLRAAWAALGPNKDFLTFIHTYATSALFHSPNQIKFLTSHERALYIANKINLDNFESYLGGANYNGGRAGTSVGGVITDDDAGDFFRPLHNVFGGQTSFEAADSALAFESNYNRWTDNDYRYRDVVGCDSCDLGNSWEKKWEQVLPRRADGQYYVSDVARWLWKHAVGNLDNYTVLEEAHLYTLLGAARRAPGRPHDQDHFFDFPLLACMVNDYRRKVPAADLSINNLMSNNVWDDYCDRGDDGVSGYSDLELADLNRSYSGQDIQNNAVLNTLVNNLGNVALPLNSQNTVLRRRSRQRVQTAMAFIFTTPFIFAEEQQ